MSDTYLYDQAATVMYAYMVARSIRERRWRKKLDHEFAGANWTPEETGLAIGVIYPNTGDPWRVWFDNIIYQLF